MTLHHRVRWGLAAAAGLATTVLSAPAQASGPDLEPYFKLTAGNVGVGTGAKGLDLRVQRAGDGPDQLQDAYLTIDTTKATGIATVTTRTLPACTTEGTVITCALGTHTIGSGSLPRVEVTAAAGATPGQTGSLVIKLGAKGYQAAAAYPDLTVAEEIDLVAEPDKITVETTAGATVDTSIGVRNATAKPVRGVVLQLTATKALRYTGTWSNCVAEDTERIYCRFDQELAAGTGYRLPAGLLSIDKGAAAGSSNTYTHRWMTADDYAERAGFPKLPAEPGDTPLTLTAAPAARAATPPATDSDARDNLGFGYVKIKAAPAPAPSASASPSPSASASASASPSAAAPTASMSPAAGETGGNLPTTGVDVITIALGGLALTGIGGSLLVLAHRRRSGITA